MKSAPCPPLAFVLLACLLASSPRVLASDQHALDEIFSSWFVGQGGFGSAAVRAYEIEQTVIFEGTNRPQIEMHVICTVSGHFRFELARAGSATVVQAYDGRVGWQSQPDWGLGLAANMDADAWVMQNDLLFAIRAFRPRIYYRALDPEVLNGHACIVAAVTDANKVEGKCFFDRKTHQLIRIERALGPGSAAKIVANFDDFRPVGTLVIPFKMRVQLGDVVTSYCRSKIVINPPVDEASFVLSTEQLREATELDAVVRNHDATLGTAEAFARIRSRITHLSLEISTTGTKSSETISQKLPNLILLEVDTPGMGREWRGYDGKSGWLYSEMEGYRPLKPAELTQLVNEGSIHLVGHLKEALPFRRRIGERVVNGQLAVAIALASQDGPAGTFYFDKENGRLLRIGLPVAGDRENTTESTNDFMDFREIDGVEIPFVLVQTNPLVRAVSTVQSLSLIHI